VVREGHASCGIWIKITGLLASFDFPEEDATEEVTFVLGSGPHWSAMDFFKATITRVEVGYNAATIVVDSANAFDANWTEMHDSVLLSQ